MRAYLARTETFVYNQMATLRRYRAVVAAHHRREASDYPLEEGLIAMESLPGGAATLERAAYRALRATLPPANAALARYLRNQGAELLHYHYLTDARFLLGVQRRTGLPSVVSGYGYDVSSFPQRWRGLGRRYLSPLFNHMDLFLAMSHDMAEDITALGCPENKVRVHYYGSETERFRHPRRSYDRDPATVLCCARLHPAKGVQLVLEALRAIERGGGPGFRVVIAGEGPHRAELERQVSEYRWDDRVEFTGHIPHTSEELVGQFRRADVFAHPSITIDGLKEGIPGTIVEAMASGLPVVATRHAGIPAVIESGEQGLLVDERDVDELAGALGRLLRERDLRRRLGAAAAARAAGELDLRVRSRELERVYDDLLDAAPTR